MKPAKSKYLRRTPATAIKSNSIHQDPLGVYCRIRPLLDDFQESCIQVISNTQVQITQPDSLVTQRNGAAAREIQYTFCKVFNEDCTQREIFEVIGLPLVSQLVNGRDGLLFTYGITGSGKTYTMSGIPSDGGIMPRCLDTLFNSISSHQAKKCSFKPDKFNGFEIQDEADTLLSQQQAMAYFNHGARKRREIVQENGDSSQRAHDRDTVVSTLDKDSVFAVFVSYIEIYNNSVFDLLDDIDPITKKPSNKVIREDANHKMYVHMGIEVEVKSADEAFEVFCNGQKKKKVANTQLNDCSSRSHSVFTIRLVRAPLDENGENIIQDKKAITVSQLSLVDLAGSERTNRTKNTGDRLKEAGNINNSLMILRQCLEVLRENQKNQTEKIVPYRDTRLTQLFKSYFDGEGQVKMIVCLNPSANEYEETLHVMNFAEMSQDVQVTRAQPKLDGGFIPGRRRAHILYKKKLEEMGTRSAVKELELDINIQRSFDLRMPSINWISSGDHDLLRNLKFHLQHRITSNAQAMEDFITFEDKMRRDLYDFDGRYGKQTFQMEHLKSVFDIEKKKVTELENQLQCLNTENDSLRRKLEDRNRQLNTYKQQVHDKEMIINQKRVEKEKVKEKFVTKIAATREKLTKEMNEKLLQKTDEIANEAKQDREKLKLIQDVIKSDTAAAPLKRERTVLGTPLALNSQGTYFQPASEVKRVVPLNRRRSRSVGGGRDKWLDHKPQTPVPLNTVFQPRITKRKSITKLTDKKDVVNTKTSKYCLTTQDQDADGEIETRLYQVYCT